jgi:bacterioferritin-associated ferredoxin
MNQSPLLQRPDYLVCTCMGVMYSDIVQAIKEGDDTYAKLQERLFVGTGCNSCVDEVKEMVSKKNTL